MPKSNIFIISGPSGAGEDSIIEGLKSIFPVERIVTTTTREMRPGEIEGKSYYFISHEEFQKSIAENKFFEHAELDRNNLYGVTFQEIERVEKLDKIILWKIDYKGVLNAKKLLLEVISIFIDVPPEVIRQRIKKRDNASEEFIQKRLAYAQGWYDNRDKFNYVVKNEDGKLDEAIQKVAEIIKAHAKLN